MDKKHWKTIGKHKNNIAKTLLGSHGETIGKSLENHGKAMGKPMEKHCKTTAKPWETHQKTIETIPRNQRKNVGNTLLKALEYHMKTH